MNNNARNNIPPFGEEFRVGDVLVDLTSRDRKDPRAAQGRPPRMVKVMAINFPRPEQMERLIASTSTSPQSLTPGRARWVREKARRELTLYELSPLGPWWKHHRRESLAPEKTLRLKYRRMTDEEKAEKPWDA